MVMSTENVGKAELMDRISQGWEDLERVLAGLEQPALERVDPETGWAIKDHLFHLAAWERGVAYLIDGRPRYEGMGVTQAEWLDLDMDATNQVIFERNRDRSGAEALAYFREAHRDMLDALAPLGDADLYRAYAEYDVEEGEFPDRPIIGWIIADTYEHYAEHTDTFRTLLGAR
jgi:hypothetical protein